MRVDKRARMVHFHPNQVFLFVSSVLLVFSGLRCRFNNDGHTTSEALATSNFSPLTAFHSSRKKSWGNNNELDRIGLISRGGSTIGNASSKTECHVSSKVGVQPTQEGASEDENNEKVKDKHNEQLPYAGFDNEDIGDIIECDYIAESDLPTEIGHFRLRAYRIADKSILSRYRHFGAEPCVIYSTEKPPFKDNGGKGSIGEGLYSGNEVPVRIHDQCFTSEVFGSQRCDCKQQLKMALKSIKKNGGCVIYLQQEGRGIGLANKVAAYAMQDIGLDTVDANTHLGFPEDCRAYGVVPSILSDMGIKSIKLMTNNPRKIERLTSLGINVVDTIPMVISETNPHNLRYLQTKQDRMDHKNLGNMLSTQSVFPADPSPVPLKSSIAEEYINDGEEMAASAVVMALSDEQGVTAKEDGYCFGRQSVVDAIEAVSRGEIVVVVDDMDRENEGDFIMAADLATPETIGTIVRYSSGVICIGMEGERMDQLNLPAMVSDNEDPKNTAFSVTVDASSAHGITTGISASDRTKTLNLLASDTSVADDFCRPGHIFPLRARDGGVLTRDGHTEAAVDLSRLAGRHPSGVLCEIVSEDNPSEMARLPELKRFCKKHGYVLTSIVDIAQYRRETETNKHS
jgi:3,4-dihydroxy 2-butanone 4-phosphate synthase/GTP cyclohydrolase II